MIQLLLAAIFVSGALSLEASFQVVQQTEEIPERGTVQQLVIHSAIGEFALNPPPTWMVSVRKEDESLRFSLEQENAILSVSFSTNRAPTVQQLKTTAGETWPDSRIVERASSFSRDARGEMLEFIYPLGARNYRTRIALLPAAGGHIRVQLTAADNWPHKLQNSWTFVLNSLHALPPVSPKRAAGQ